MDSEVHTTNSEEETIQLGRSFAERLQVGDVVSMYGELGAGKTEFVKGVCDYFNVGDLVSSPTYTIMNQYDGEHDDAPLRLYHIDLFRIKSSAELDEIGFDDCVYSHNSIKLIEWAEKADGHLPSTRYQIVFKLNPANENERRVEITHIATEMS